MTYNYCFRGLVRASILGGLTGGFSAFGVVDRLKELVAEQGMYITRYDFFNLLYVTNDFNTFSYLSRDNISLLFFPTIFYLLGIIIVTGEFLLKPREYVTFYYGRAQSIKETIKLLRGYGGSYVGCYTSFYLIVVYIFSFLCIPIVGSQHNIPEYNLLIFLVLHSIGQWLAFLLFREIMLHIYCKAGVTASFSAGFLVLLIILLLDMQMSFCNLLLFLPKNYFADSIIIMALSYIFFRVINNRSMCTNLPY